MKLDVQPPNFIYCPFCGQKLSVKAEENKSIKFCKACAWAYYPHVGGSANAIIIDSSKVLLVKRNREPYLGTWMFPAGFIDYGEHPQDTIVREVKEEVGLKVISTSLIDILQTVDDPQSPGHFAFFYQATVQKGTATNSDQDENSQIAWFDLDNLPPIGWQNHQKIIQRFVNHKSD